MKKSTYLFAIALGVSTISLAQNVGINTDGSDPDTDALLHLLNTNSTALDPLIRLENQQNASVNGIELLNSGGATAAEWDLYIPSSSTDFRVSNGTTDHVTIQNDGDVGIGTSTPTVPLDIEATNAAIDINNTSTDPLIHFQVSGTTNFTIGTDVTDSKFKIGTTALETGTAITVQPTGEVGIGTTSPSFLLTTNYNANATFTNTATDFAQMWQNSGVNALGIATSDDLTARLVANNGYAIGFNIAGSDAMTITTGSKVGIGTSSPGARLEVYDNVNSPVTLRIFNPYDSDPGFDVYTEYGVKSTGAIPDFSWSTGIDASDDEKFKFSTATVAWAVPGTSDILTLTRDGEVGIGTSSPDELLHVSGSSVGDGAHIGNGFIGVWEGNTGYACFTHNTVKATAASYAVLQGSLGDTYLNAASGRDLHFRINNVDGITLNSDRTIQLHAYGAGTLTTDASGNVTASSDERLKNIQGDYTRGLTYIKNIQPITYKWKSSTGNDSISDYSGFSAQNVQANIPEAIGVDPKGYLTISDRPIIAALVNAVNEQQAIIEAQKAENESQKAEIENLKQATSSASINNAQKIAALEAKLNALLLNQNVTLSAKK